MTFIFIVFLTSIMEVISAISAGIITALILAVGGFFWKINSRFSTQDTTLAVILVKLDGLQKEVDQIKSDLKGK